MDLLKRIEQIIHTGRLPFEAAVALGDDAAIARAWARATNAPLVEWLAVQFGPPPNLVPVLLELNETFFAPEPRNAWWLSRLHPDTLADAGRARAAARLHSVWLVRKIYDYAAGGGAATVHDTWVRAAVDQRVELANTSCGRACVDVRRVNRELARWLAARLPPPTLARLAELVPPT